MAAKLRNTLTTTEHQEQAAFIRAVKWCSSQWPDLKNVFAIPNAGKRSFGAANYYKAEGLESGVPDVFVAIPTENYHGLFIEFKRRGGNISSAQLSWLRRLGDMKYHVAVCFSGNEALIVVARYLDRMEIITKIIEKEEP